jgi:hypothetical protein
VFRVICEVLFAVSLVICVIQQPFLIYRTFRQVRSDIGDDAITQSKKLKENVEPLKEVIDKIRLVVMVIYEHFSSPWNILNLLCIVLSLVSAIYWVIFLFYRREYDIDYALTAPITKRHYINDDALSVCETLYTCRNMCAFSLAFIFIRLLKCTTHFIPGLTIMFNTLDKAKYHLFFFFVITMAVLFASVLFMYFCFEPVMISYAEITEAIMIFFKLMNSWYRSFYEVSDYDIFFVIFSTLMSFILLNYLVGFLHRSYKEAT